MKSTRHDATRDESNRDDQSRNETRRYLGLCIRCQRRVDWIEKKQGFRSECERETGSVCSCYGFVPVKPIVLEKTHKDARPLVGPSMFAARACSKAEAKCGLDVRTKGRKAVLYWTLDKVQ